MAAGVAPGAVYPVGAPYRCVVVDEDVFGVAGFGDLFLAFDDAAEAVVFNVLFSVVQEERWVWRVRGVRLVTWLV